MKATLPLIIVITLVGCSDGRLSEDEYAKAAQAIGRTAKAEMDEFARTDDFPDPALGVEQASVFMEKRIDKAIAAAKIAWQSVDSLKPPKKYDGFHAATGALYRASHDGLVQLRTHFRGSPTRSRKSKLRWVPISRQSPLELPRKRKSWAKTSLTNFANSATCSSRGYCD